MDNQIIQNHLGSLGHGAPSSQTQEEMSIYDFAIAHVHEHITQDGHWTYCDEENQTMVDLARDASEELAILREKPSHNAAQNALSQIQNNFKEEMIDFSMMKDIGQIDAELNEAIAYDTAHEHYATSHWSWGACGVTTDEHIHASMADGIVSANDSKAALEPCLLQAESNIKALTDTRSDSTLSDLLSTFNGFIEKNSSSETTGPSYLNDQEDSKAIKTLLNMIKEQLEIDSGYEKTKKGSVQKLSLHEEMILEANQTEALDNLLSSIDAALSTVNGNKLTDQGNLELNEMQASTLGAELGYGSANKNLLNAKYLQNAVDRLYRALETAKNDLAGVEADVANYSFQSLMSAVNTLMNEVKAILTSKKLTPKEKEDKLALILQQLLGFLQMFIQIAQNLRSENKQKMERATIKAQKSNIQTLKIDGENLQKLHAEQIKLERTEKIMNIIETVAMVAFILTASVGGAIAMSTMFALDKTGVTQKWTQDLAHAEGSKVGGSATMTGIAMVLTLLGGVGIDACIQRLGVSMKAEILQAEANAEHEISNSIDNIDSHFNHTLTKEQVALIKETVDKTATLAANNAAKEFYKDLSAVAAAKLLYSRAQGITDKKFAKFVTQSVETAIKDAVKDLEQALIVQPNIAQPLLTSELVESVSENAASKILSKTDGVVASPNAGFWEKMKVRTDNAYNKFIENTPQAVRSGLWAGLYTAADTNLLMNAIFGNQNANSKANQKTSKMIEQVLLHMIQMLMQVLAMMKGGGVMDQLQTSDSFKVVQGIQRSSSIMQVSSQAVNAETDYVQYGIDKNQAQAVKSWQEAQSYNTMLRTLSNQDHHSADESASGLSVEEKRLAQEQAWLAAHFWDGMNAGNKVLAAQSV